MTAIRYGARAGAALLMLGLWAGGSQAIASADEGSADQKASASVGGERSASQHSASSAGKRARNKSLKPEEMTGSTFTVSNLGMYGIESFTAVINPGEAAILAVGAITDEVVAVDGQMAIRKVMRATLCSDHRVFDGADNARFLATLKKLLEAPMALFT